VAQALADRGRHAPLDVNRQALPGRQRDAAGDDRLGPRLHLQLVEHPQQINEQGGWIRKGQSRANGNGATYVSVWREYVRAEADEADADAEDDPDTRESSKRSSPIWSRFSTPTSARTRGYKIACPFPDDVVPGAGQDPDCRLTCIFIAGHCRALTGI